MEKRKIYFLRILFIILVIATCCIIYSFSNQDGEESGSISSNLVKQIVTIFKIDENSNREFLKQMEVFIRKMAHFSIYAILGIWLMCLMETFFYDKEWAFNTKIKWRMTIAGFLGFIYACSDEIHQSFIPERSMQLSDIFLDTLGILSGIVFIAIILYIRKHKYEKRNITKTLQED